MCATVYLREWVNTSLKQSETAIKVKLDQDVNFAAPLTYFLECSTAFNENAELVAHPFIGHGSGDFANLVAADGFIILPAEQGQFKKGEVFDFVPYRSQF